MNNTNLGRQVICFSNQQIGDKSHHLNTLLIWNLRCQWHMKGKKAFDLMGENNYFKRLFGCVLHWHYRVRHLTFFFQLVLISLMVTLSLCLISQIISFILPPNEYGCAYAWTTLGNIATDRLTEDADFGKKIIFSDDCRFWHFICTTSTYRIRHSTFFFN